MVQNLPPISSVLGQGKIIIMLSLGATKSDPVISFRYTDSTISLLLIQNFKPLAISSVIVQPGLCWTWSEPKLMVFSHIDSNKSHTNISLFSVSGKHAREI